MSERPSNIVNADQLAWIDTAEVTRAASPADRDRGQQFGSRAKPLGRTAGSTRLGCTLYELPPGKCSFPFHYHLANEEAIYILDGEATLRQADREIAVGPGDYLSFPTGPGHPHQLVNRSAAPVRYLCMSTLQTPEVAIYPDSRKAGFTVSVNPEGVSTRQFHRLGESLPYYDGEDG